MRQLLLLSVLFSAFLATAQAEVFECTLSEPALNVRYDSESERVTIKKDLLGQPDIKTDISFHILASNIYVLKSSDGKQVARITLSNNGTDGATETLYPFDIELNSLSTLANRGIGGCSSTLLKSVKR